MFISLSKVNKWCMFIDVWVMRKLYGIFISEQQCNIICSLFISVSKVNFSMWYFMTSNTQHQENHLKRENLFKIRKLFCVITNIAPRSFGRGLMLPLPSCSLWKGIVYMYSLYWMRGRLLLLPMVFDMCPHSHLNSHLFFPSKKNTVS